jgi:protocatechuate 3,4-dioxygenase alpha subunit
VRGTAGQTVGPFFGYALPYPGDSEVVPRSHPGALRLRGRVLDGAENPVPDALLEIWQSGPDGAVVQRPGSLRRDGWTFTGWGRCATDNAGRYGFTTLAPASFWSVTVFARGLLDRLSTRIYLPSAPVPDSVPPERRTTIVAQPADGGYSFGIRLQGAEETVFFSFPGYRDDRS